VFGWRGESREAALALLRVVAEAKEDRLAVALALIEGGRLQMEIGRPADARALLTRALELGASLPKREFQRAWVNLLQAAVAAGQVELARAQLAGMPEALAQAPPRLLLLGHLESARVEMKSGDFAAAMAALDQARIHAPAGDDAFERVEIAEVEAELALARGDAQKAAALFGNIISRYADDDLAAREVRARLIHAAALEALNHTEEAERTLSAALRRALARGLTGHADEVRSRLMADHGGPGRTPGLPVAGAEVDPQRRFVRQRALGSGAFGKVMRAYDLELGVEVAIKRASRGQHYDPAIREQLLQAARTEVAATSRLDHPGIARVYGLLAVEGGDTLVIEEYVEGRTLRETMQTGLDRAHGFNLLSRIAFALAAVHGAGVIHRDLKPDNIILRGGDAPVLIDFGVALLAGKREMPGAGTPAYMAPEQARGRSVDERADLYSLGVIAYELLMGERPEPPRSLVPFTGLGPLRRINTALVQAGIDKDAAGLVTRLLAPRPALRPRSAAAIGNTFALAGGLR
jgi:tRNA A-37 threonylcarbamoyl transferase component Bud32